MGVTLWTFLMLPDGTVERYPLRQYERFCDREAALGVVVGTEAQFVELAIETRRGHPLRMMRAWFNRYELDVDGFVSEEHRQRRMHDAVDAISFETQVGGDPDVLSLEPRIARQRSRREHAWQPDAIQLQSIVEAINHDAAKDLVKSDARTVRPV